jgi:hypothetical protein
MSKLLCFVFPIALQFSKKGYDVQLFVLHMKICRIISYCMYLPSLIFGQNVWLILVEIIQSIWIQQRIGSDVAPQVFSVTQIFSGELLFSTYLFWLSKQECNQKTGQKFHCRVVFVYSYFNSLIFAGWEPLTTVHSRVELLVKSFVLTDLTSVHLYWSHWKLVGGPKLANKSLWVPCISWVWWLWW